MNNFYSTYNIDVNCLLRDYITYPLNRYSGVNGGFSFENPPSSDLYYLYIEKNLSKTVICQYFNFGKTKLTKLLKEYGIKRDKNVSKKNREMTCLKKYGVKHNSQIGFVKENNIKNNIKKYGVEHYFQTDDFKNKSKETLYNEFGVYHNSQLLDVQKSIKDTNYKKFGNEKFSRSNYFRNCFGLEPIDDNLWEMLDDKNMVEKYIIDNNIESIEQMAIKLNVSKGFINKIINDYNLKQYIIYSSSYPEKCWLDSLHICKSNRQVRIGKYIVDGYDPTTNTIYEFLGDYWHGNPKIYKPFEYNKKVGKTFGELYENTIKRNEELELLGYNVVFMWESEYNLTK